MMAAWWRPKRTTPDHEVTMPSTISTPITARIPNDHAAELQRLAALSGRTVSWLVAAAVRRQLAELRDAA
jgi:uncharacterized protein (DUF1778 family)